MPRQARLDAPGTLHHVMARGIDGAAVFRTDNDREDFISHLGNLCSNQNLVSFAWALLPSHFHILVKSGKTSLSNCMRSLLTGFAVRFNLRHNRKGHLFQNRFKSIVCEEEAYLLELIAYIHLNPFRLRIVRDMEELARYPWSGHSAILGSVRRDWQDTQGVLDLFGNSKKSALSRYSDFIRERASRGKRPELTGGGLLRSQGGWGEVLSMRSIGIASACDERILGSSEFISKVLDESDEMEKQKLRLTDKKPSLQELALEVIQIAGISLQDLNSGGKALEISRARRLLCVKAVRTWGYSGAAVARFLGISTSAANRNAKAIQT